MQSQTKVNSIFFSSQELKGVISFIFLTHALLAGVILIKILSGNNRFRYAYVAALTN